MSRAIPSKKRVFLFGLALLFLLLVMLPFTVLRVHEGGSAFITKSGPNLLVHGSPLRLVGYNWRWMGTGCGAPTNTEIATVFSQIETASRGNVVRTAFYQSGSNLGAYTNFDRYIAAARKHGVYLVPILVNHWTNCEPSTAAKTTAWYESGYTQANDGYPLSFLEYARKLASHYANEPTIAFWQLVNEPDTGLCGAGGARILRRFADDMVTALKAVDPHHLVDLGVPGKCAAPTPSDYTLIVGGKVDLCDVWHDYGQAAQKLPAPMLQRIGICKKLNKPSLVGESGMCADITTSATCSGPVTSATLQQRAHFFETKLATGFGAGLAGYLIWQKGSESVEDAIGPGDPTESVVASYALPPGS